MTEFRIIGTAAFRSIRFEPLIVSQRCTAPRDEFVTYLPAALRRAGVRPYPGASGQVEVAMGIVAAFVERNFADDRSRQRCHAEVLRAAGFKDVLPLAKVRELNRNR